ncbi:Rid family hydrolase [Paraburkholderia strydomiana]|uniref:Rid family hydrolase n=1 Tax=Paraburkholderia strydomiana TaxID=1245417 RepID=UPI0028595071|nr:Rid family hydrolase [Paraburkholderia strydomiana]MDR7009470.1 enamine deaminase RidA (YjgF/YER057c/UK114 family) [Paraburkholderia strydomiana]
MKERKAVVPAGMEAVYERIRYAPAVKIGNTIYVSGQVGRDEKMQLVEGREAQTVQAFENLKKVLEAAGASLSDVVDLTTFHTDSMSTPPLPRFSNSTSRQQSVNDAKYPIRNSPSFQRRICGPPRESTKRVFSEMV